MIRWTEDELAMLGADDAAHAQVRQRPTPTIEAATRVAAATEAEATRAPRSALPGSRVPMA